MSRQVAWHQRNWHIVSKSQVLFQKKCILVGKNQYFLLFYNLVFPLIDSFLAQSTRLLIPWGAFQPKGIFRSLRERNKTILVGLSLGQVLLSPSRVSLLTPYGHLLCTCTTALFREIRDTVNYEKTDLLPEFKCCSESVCPLLCASNEPKKEEAIRQAF